MTDQVPHASANNEILQPLNLYSLRDLEYRLSINRELLRVVASGAGRFYDPFPKERPSRPFQKKLTPLKVRSIDNPVGTLKDIQKRICRRLLDPLDFPSHICGGVKGRSVLQNVGIHCGAGVLVTLDIRNFFPSVTTFHVYSVWTQLLNCSPKIAKLLTQLTTFERHLPQGAHTSTALANLVLYFVDAPIREACERAGVRYSTYVDDIAFSGDRAPDVIQTSIATLQSVGFAISHKKLKVMRSGARMVLNGVNLGRRLGVGSQRYSAIRSGIHKYRTGQVQPAQSSSYLRSLEGNIAQLATINPHRATRLADALSRAKAERGRPEEMPRSEVTPSTAR
jgi:RNA-directed DNA polymerase